MAKKKLTPEIISVSLNISPVNYFPKEHEYWLGDKQLNGITGMIGRQLFPDKYKDIPEAVLKKAAKRGSNIHDDCDAADSFGIINSPEAGDYLNKRTKLGFEHLSSEYIVSDEVCFATPIDKVFIKDGMVFLADIKTTYKLDEEYVAWQLSICEKWFKELNPDLEIGGLYAIWIRNGKVLFKEVKRVPIEDVNRLLDCEINGVIYSDNSDNSESSEIQALPEELNKSLILVQDFEALIVQKEREAKELKELRDKYVEVIESAFKESGIKSWETEKMKISLVDSTEKRTFDSKRFAEENAELAEKYYKVSNVKGYVKITLKNK